MIFVRIIDEQGFFISDEFVDELTPKTIETPCPAGFYHPKWDGEKWVEGGQAPEPTIPEPTDIEVLQAENQKLKERIVATEQIAAETSNTQQQLLELLIEMEVI